MNTAIIITPSDNVAVALVDIAQGTSLELGGNTYTVTNDIPRGHKFALRNIELNEDVIKYGYSIGHATELIEAGSHIHSHNLKTSLEGTLTYTYSPKLEELIPSDMNLTFEGYVRKNGEVGIRNEIWIVPTVGCVNGIGERMINQLRREYNDPTIDSVEIFKHNYGCSQLGDDHENTRKILSDIALHPNAGGVLVLGLGCENNQISAFQTGLGDFDKERIFFLETQKVGDEFEEGMALLRKLADKMLTDKRETVSITKLKLGLKCGGSDGLSGITANPLLGKLSDFVIARGSTTVLTEVPEMFGAETILMNRAVNQDVFERTVSMVNDFKEYFIQNNQPIYENPSPGNKQGGISTLEEKSLGCTQKCGSAPVTEVLKYGERIRATGLHLLSAPGNDLVASTALGASGCQMVLFTTGRGTPFGSFVPTLKISTNNALAEKKPHWIDFNAGPIAADGDAEQVFADFLKLVIETASGKLAKHEQHGIREIAIFKTGVTL